MSDIPKSTPPPFRVARSQRKREKFPKSSSLSFICGCSHVSVSTITSALQVSIAEFRRSCLLLILCMLQKKT